MQALNGFYVVLLSIIDRTHSEAQNLTTDAMELGDVSSVTMCFYTVRWRTHKKNKKQKS